MKGLEYKQASINTALGITDERILIRYCDHYAYETARNASQARYSASHDQGDVNVCCKTSYILLAVAKLLLMTMIKLKCNI